MRFCGTSRNVLFFFFSRSADREEARECKGKEGKDIQNMRLRSLLSFKSSTIVTVIILGMKENGRGKGRKHSQHRCSDTVLIRVILYATDSLQLQTSAQKRRAAALA